LNLRIRAKIAQVIRKSGAGIAMDEYVPWPDDGCNLGASVNRLAAGIGSNIESVKESCRRHLLCGDLIAYGRTTQFDENVLHVIKPAIWSALTIDWRRTKVLRPDGVEISDIRIFPPVFAPCRVEILDQMPIAEAFRRFVLKDPEVEALAAIALPMAPKWKPYFGKGQSTDFAGSEWSVDLDRWWFAKPVHPNPEKQCVFERRDNPDRLELVIAVEALKHRYRSLMSLLQRGEMTARGVPARAGFSEQIMRSVWSHEAFHLRISTGDVLQDNEQSVDKFDRTLKSWIGVVLCKPANATAEAPWEGRSVSPATPLFHVNNTGSDVSLPNTTSPAEQTKQTKRRIDTVTTSYRECVTWLAQLMRDSPNTRTATIDELWHQAKVQWPGTLSRRGFESARNEAIKASGAQAWTAAGRSRKSPQAKSPR
jgi:hypothetical protein